MFEKISSYMMGIIASIAIITGNMELALVFGVLGLQWAVLAVAEETGNKK